MVRGKRGPALLEVIRKGSTPGFLRKSEKTTDTGPDDGQNRLIPEEMPNSAPQEHDRESEQLVDEAEQLADEGDAEDQRGHVDAPQRRQDSPQLVSRSQPASLLQADDAQAIAGQPVELTNGGERPLVVFDGRYLRLSLTTTMTSFALLMLLAVMVSVYSWGVSSGRHDALSLSPATMDEPAEGDGSSSDEFESARRVESIDELFRGVGAAPVPNGDQNSQAGESTSVVTPETVASYTGPVDEWVPGYTYIVVQEFRSENRDDAFHAQAFLKERGIDAEVWEVSPRSLQLIAKRGFRWKDPDQRAMGEEFHAGIEDIGQEYRKATKGRYALQGFPKTMKGNSW